MQDAESPIDVPAGINWGAVFLPWLWSLTHRVWPWFWVFTLLQFAVWSASASIAAYVPISISLRALVWFFVAGAQWILAVRLGWVADGAVSARYRVHDSDEGAGRVGFRSWKTYIRWRTPWAWVGGVLAVLGLGGGLFTASGTYLFPIAVSRALAGTLVLAGALALARLRPARPRPEARRSNPSRAVLVLVACAAVVGAVLSARGLPPASNPGGGPTIADRVYVAIGPLTGEQVDSYGILLVPGKRPLTYRLDDAVKKNPSWAYENLGETDESRWDT